MKTYLRTIIAMIFIAATSAFADEHLNILKVKNDVYTNVTVTSVSATDIYFTCSQGMANAKLKDLDQDLQKHFGYNPDKASQTEKARTQANIQYHQQLLHDQPAAHSAEDYTRLPEARVPEGLDVGQKFPGFNVTDIQGQGLSPDAYKGKVLLIDFWATWCGPCRQELPNVIATYQHFHAQGFEIIGISLDQDQNALNNFLQQAGMPWPEYFDGQGWQNKIAVKYGVHSIPTNYLLDRHGVILGKGLRGQDLANAVGKTLAESDKVALAN
jgi:thiol-disulfide isomerase/thioredoxin